MSEYRFRDVILLVIGIVVIQFFIGLVIFHAGYETGQGSNSNAARARIVFEYCATGRPLEVNQYSFDVRCIERHPVK